jgi:ribosomal protection tetracycline resistance protein
VLGRTLNLGILAHVDAGKTTLTERLLYAAGVIDAPGSVDRGTTQTDTLELERQRGITIKAAVVSFPIGDVTVNLIDTPGHPDFIAEVERSLDVLDGAVLVVSAVEGVQAQTLVLMRALQRLRIPTLVFLNKVDRIGADVERIVAELQARVAPEAVATWAIDLPALAERDAGLLEAYVDGTVVGEAELRHALAAQTAAGLLRPVFAGSAITGAGVDALTRGIAELLPARAGDPGAPLDGTVFKIERGPDGQKVAYARLFAGSLRVRERAHGDAKVTALSVFDHGGAVRRNEAVAGEIAKVWGLREIQVGDRIGDAGSRLARHRFAPPLLEARVDAVDRGEQQQLRVALEQLSEQDPLIAFRQSAQNDELSVSIYGEVQKEVLEATLAREYGLAVTFRETTPICVERPLGEGRAIEVFNTPTNPHHATIGFLVEPLPDDSGIEVSVEVPHTDAPLYIYKRYELFALAMDEYVRESLQLGPNGWRVTDCRVTMTDSGYTLADGPPSKRGPMPTAADIRKLTPIVLAQALSRAGTAVCEPMVRATVDLPVASVGAVLAALGRLDASVEAAELRDATAIVRATLPAAHTGDLQRQLPGLTSGEGALETAFAGYRRVNGSR